MGRDFTALQQECGLTEIIDLTGLLRSTAKIGQKPKWELGLAAGCWNRFGDCRMIRIG
ncbi:MAG: hypothetical protein JNN31_03120 [Dechloromonas sp.]|nr:hypothetical protein [Dechloromonas sp.]